MEETRTITLDKYDYRLMINALDEFRNMKIKENVDVDIIDKLIIKIINAPTKRSLSLNKSMRGKYISEAR